MQYDHEHHQRTSEQTGEYLGELFEDVYREPETGHYYVRYGTTVLEISVEPYGPEETIVLVVAYCVQDVEPDEGLLRGLLELNHLLPVGSFSVVERDVFFSYAIFGKALDRKNLLGAIAAVATTADDYDDRIAKKYGGQTALDRISDTGGRRKRKQAASR